VRLDYTFSYTHVTDFAKSTWVVAGSAGEGFDVNEKLAQRLAHCQEEKVRPPKSSKKAATY
jgi:hypothetical protein